MKGMLSFLQFSRCAHFPDTVANMVMGSDYTELDLMDIGSFLALILKRFKHLTRLIVEERLEELLEKARTYRNDPGPSLWYGYVSWQDVP